MQQPVAGSGFGLTAVGAGLAMVPSGLAMVAFSPVSGAMINRLGGRTTLMAGSMIMGLGYVGRVFYSDTLAAVIVGSTVVSIGSAVAYAAMPSLIMANVPITETASANGLNALLRALGTSTASAVIAAVLSVVTVTVGTVELPTAAAFRDVFWLAAFAALISCATVWFVPKREREPAAVGSTTEIVIHSWVRQSDNRPIPHAVVTAVDLAGQQLDWSRADNDGAFSLALPRAGRYLLIANADGWRPQSTVLDFAGAPAVDPIHLVERLMLVGRVRRSGAVLPGVLVTLSARTGELRASTTTDTHGRYELRLPPPGHNILTVLDPNTLQTQATKIFTTTQSAVADIDLSVPSREPELMPR